MRQRAVHEAEGNALPLHVLLPHARNHLTDVDEAALGASRDHAQHVVGVRQTALRRVTGLVTRLVQHLIHLALERLLHRASWLSLQLLALSLHDELLHVSLGLADCVVDAAHRLCVCNRVPDADAEAVLQEPVVDEQLSLVEEAASGVRAMLLPDDVNEAAGAGADGALAQRARHQLAVLDKHLRVARAEILRLALLVPRRGAAHIHVRDEEAEHLLARPQRPRLHDGWSRDLAVPVLEPHENVVEDILLNESVALRDQAAPQQRVLNDAHHGLVRLRADDHLGHHHQLAHLGARLMALR